MAPDAHDDPRALHTHAPDDARPKLARSTRFRDLGLLILRLGIGAMYVGHGLPKIIGGPSRWTALGEAIRVLGIQLGPPSVWGFLASIAELGGGVLVATGLLFRPACAVLFLTMCVATISHVARGDDFTTTSHPAKMALVFLSLIFIGSGPWRVRVGR